MKVNYIVHDEADFAAQAKMLGIYSSDFPCWKRASVQFMYGDYVENAQGERVTFEDKPKAAPEASEATLMLRAYEWVAAMSSHPFFLTVEGLKCRFCTYISSIGYDGVVDARHVPGCIGVAMAEHEKRQETRPSWSERYDDHGPSEGKVNPHA